MKFECKIFNRCHIDKKSRNHCKSCRLAKCFRIGMQSQWVMTEYDKEDNVVERHENNQNQEVVAPRMLTDYQWRMRFGTNITILIQAKNEFTRQSFFSGENDQNVKELSVKFLQKRTIKEDLEVQVKLQNQQEHKMPLLMKN